MLIALYILLGIIIIDAIILLILKKDGKFHKREVEEEKKHWDSKNN